jgi:hypothetical protein
MAIVEAKEVSYSYRSENSITPALAGVSGFFFSDCNPVKPAGPYMEDDALAARLWQVSEQITRGYLA